MVTPPADNAKVHELVRDAGSTWFSFEYFPPRTALGQENLHRRIARMKSCGPLFADFTWGAGGCTSKTTLELACAAKNVHGVVSNMHLTCTNVRAEMVDETLAACKAAGVRNVVALRGDPPHGETKWSATEGGFTCGLDLVRHIQKKHGDYFSVSVAGYPEGHPDNIEEVVGGLASLTTSEIRRSRVWLDEDGKQHASVCRDANFAKELAYLKDKVSAGANAIITQMFFDADVFLDFVAACRDGGITVPIIPGIMCFSTFNGLLRMTGLCKSRLPPDFVEQARAAGPSDEAFRAWCAEFNTGMCKKLLTAGVSGLHLYTLNMERVAVAVLLALGLVTAEQAAVCLKSDADSKQIVSPQGVVQGWPSGLNRPLLLGNRTLAEADPTMHALVLEERARQIRGIELIASENFTSRAVMECLGSALTNKYSEGQPGARYYAGNEVIDKVENLCKERALKAFGLNEEWGVNVQPYSGSPANFAVYTALLQPHARIMGLDLPSGGHLTHGFYTPKKKISATSIYFESLPYRVHPESGLVDFDELRRMALVYRPALIICGASAYPRFVEFEKFKAVADEVGSYLMADIAHVSGLVATGFHPSPFPFCDVVTTTSHKSLRGPRAGVIFYKLSDQRIPNIKERIDMAVFPGLQGGPHNHQIAALATQLLEVQSVEFRDYARNVVQNSAILAKELMSKGYALASGGTDNHLILWDLRPSGVTGNKMEKVCESVSITLNRNSVHGDVSAFSPGGVRIGSPAMTTRGCGEEHFVQIANFLDRCLKMALRIQEVSGKKLKDFEAALEKDAEVETLKNEVESWSENFGYPGL